MNKYPHMCRDDHAEIGHSDSEHERCPLCRALGRVDRLEEALQKIAQWAEAYPLDVFPEPDWKRSNEVLKQAGLSLSGISASNMRHVVTRVGDMARAALT